MCHHLFPVQQVQYAIFHNLLALSGGSRHPNGGFEQSTEKRRTVAWLGRRLLQQGF